MWSPARPGSAPIKPKPVVTPKTPIQKSLASKIKANIVCGGITQKKTTVIPTILPKNIKIKYSPVKAATPSNF